MASTTAQTPLPEIVVFGASMAEWSFKEKTQGYGWFLEKMYAGKAWVVNEGIEIAAWLSTWRTYASFMLRCIYR